MNSEHPLLHSKFKANLWWMISSLKKTTNKVIATLGYARYSLGFSQNGEITCDKFPRPCSTWHDSFLIYISIHKLYTHTLEHERTHIYTCSHAYTHTRSIHTTRARIHTNRYTHVYTHTYKHAHIAHEQTGQYLPYIWTQTFWYFQLKTEA